MATQDDYRRIALSLPEVIEEPHYGSPAFKAGKKFFTRLREDGENLVIPMNRDERDFWIESEPGLFHVTPQLPELERSAGAVGGGGTGAPGPAPAGGMALRCHANHAETPPSLKAAGLLPRPPLALLRLRLS